MFMKKRKAIAWLIALVMLIPAVLAGCGSQDSTISNVEINKDGTAAQKKDGDVTLKVWWGVQTPERTKLAEETFAKFQQKEPGIKIDFLGVPGDANQYKQKVDMAIAAGDVPDVAVYLFRSDYIERDVYEPLDEYFAKWEGKDQIAPSVIESYRTMDYKNKKLYSLPQGSLVWVLWLRPDWFKEANLAIPESWDDVFNAIPKLTDKAKGRYGLSIRGGSGAAQNLEYLMYSYSGITEYFTKDGQCTINDPLHLEFVEKYLGAYNVYTPEDDLNKGWTELAATFQSGKAAIIAHNLGSAASHEKAFNGDYSKFMALTYPKSKKGNVVHPAIEPYGVTMMKKSTHKEEAWKLMTFLVSSEADGDYAKLYSEVPANLEAAKADWIQKLPYMKSGADFLASDTYKFYENPNYLPEYKSIGVKDIDPLVQKVMAKKMSAKEMLDQWAELMKKSKDEFDKTHQ